MRCISLLTVFAPAGGFACLDFSCKIFLIQKLNNGHKNKIMTNNYPAQAANAVSGTSAVSDDQVVLTPQCPACGRQENIVWVHGHGQCAHCHTNVMPCCDGAICEQPS